MTNIIGLDLADSSSDETRVFVNTDNVTHWHHEGDKTVVHFTGGTSITVAECPWAILDRIEPEPDCYEDVDNDPGWDVMNIEYTVTAGQLEPGQTVTLTDTATFRNGETVDTPSTGVFDNEYESDGELYLWFTGMRMILKGGKFSEPEDVGIPARYFRPGGGPSGIALREAATYN